MPWSEEVTILVPGEIQHYQAHSTYIDSSDFMVVWQSISDIYDLVDNREHVSTIHEAWGRLAGVWAAYRKLKQYSVSWQSQEFTFLQTPPMPVELAFVEEEPSEEDAIDGVEYCIEDTDDPTGHAYFIPEWFRSILVLQDFLKSPVITLVPTRDYDLDIEQKRGKKGRIVFHDDVLWSATMWATNYREKKIEDILGRFGVLVGYEEIRNEDHEEIDILRIFLALLTLQLYGPTPERLEAAVAAVNDWPFSYEECTVAEVRGVTELLVRPTAWDGPPYTIPNTTGLPFVVRDDDGEWVAITTGMTLSPMAALTQACRVFTKAIDPDFGAHFSLGKVGELHRMVVALDDDLPKTPILLEYENLVGGPWNIGDVITGTSGAYATIIDDDPDALDPTIGVLSLSDLVANFEAGEVITGAIAGTADAVGPAYMEYEDIDWQIIQDVLERNKKAVIDFLLFVWLEWMPEGYIDAEHTTHAAGPSLDETEDVHSSYGDIPDLSEIRSIITTLEDNPTLEEGDVTTTLDEPVALPYDTSKMMTTMAEVPGLPEEADVESSYE